MKYEIFQLTLYFDLLHPNREEQFFDRWDITRDIITAALQDCKRLTGDDSGYYHALSSLAQHNKDAVLYLLPYLIKPPRGSLGEGKISIREKQESFLIHAQTAADIDRALERQRQICIDTQSPLQPIPVFVGPLVNLEAFYVYINDSLENPTIYQAPSALHVIDLTFEVIFVLKCAFTKRSASIWIFIQKALYGINLPNDKCSRDTNVLIARILRQVELGNENLAPNQV